MSLSKEQLKEILTSLTKEDLIGLIDFHLEEIVRQEKESTARKLFLSGYTYCCLQNYNLSVLLNSVILPSLDEVQTAWFITVSKAYPVYLHYMYGEKENAK